MSDLQKYLSNWIQTYTWDYFITITTRRPRRDAIALMRDIWEELTLPENQYWSNPDKLHLPCRGFLACETFAYSHNLHCHGLIAGIPHALYLPRVIQKPLDHRFGRSRVESVKSVGKVSSYCSKYVTKLGDGDNWNFYGNFFKN